jgi:hypothetical protein
MRNYSYHRRESGRGFIAIIAVLIIAGMLSGLVASASTSIFWTRSNQLDYQHSAEAEVQSYACIHAALTAFAEDHTYNPNKQIVHIDTEHICFIDTLSATDATITVTVHSIASTAAVWLKLQGSRNIDGTVSAPFVITKL